MSKSTSQTDEGKSSIPAPMAGCFGFIGKITTRSGEQILIEHVYADMRYVNSKAIFCRIHENFLNGLRKQRFDGSLFVDYYEDEVVKESWINIY